MKSIDKIAVSAIAFLASTIAILVWGTNACGEECFLAVKPQVSKFSWQNQTIGQEDRAFLLHFNRPVDRDSIERNLTIDPPLPGKVSWAGNKLAYTLDRPAPYGEKYRLFIETDSQKSIEPFFGQFSSRDRAFAYIGSEGKNQGKLILYNWTKQQKTILTPDHLKVLDFEPYPDGERILFSAVSKGNAQDLTKLELYSVTTGVNHDSQKIFKPQLKLILDSKKYQNYKFDLSQDGKTIIAQRISHSDSGDFRLWIIKENQAPKPIKTSATGDFVLAPDSQTLAIAQGEGIALLPLKSEAQPLDFLPKFGRVVSFANDGTAAAMVNYNKDDQDLQYTKSLYYVNNQGIEKELLNIEGSIIDCQFNPTASNLYCLLTELNFSDNVVPEQATTLYKEQPYIVDINLKTNKVTPVLSLPEYQDSKLSVAPDGLGILFDQVLTTQVADTTNKSSKTSDTAIIKSRLWLLLPPSQESETHQVEQLPLIGFRPQWLP